jgi:hypothetical protein
MTVNTINSKWINQYYCINIFLIFSICFIDSNINTIEIPSLRKHEMSLQFPWNTDIEPYLEHINSYYNFTY